ncbi:MAG: hypothetical protein GY716_15520, partial [bacterium]|nr:hypothetical protein [bacterium]
MKTSAFRTCALLILFAPLCATTTFAVCFESIKFSSIDVYTATYVHTPGVWCGHDYYCTTGSSVTGDLEGVFWALGFSEPKPGDCNCSAGYTVDQWLRHYAYPPYHYQAYFQGDWYDPGVDGCIVVAGSHPTLMDGEECMSIMLTDQFEDVGFFTLITERVRLSPPPPHFDLQAPVDYELGSIPVPQLLNVGRPQGQTFQVSVQLPPPSQGMYLDPGCDNSGALVGYRLWLRTVSVGQPPPTGRRATAGWQPETPAVQPMGGPPTVLQLPCDMDKAHYLTATLWFDGDFETLHVSGNSAAFYCCDDLDFDGYCEVEGDCDDSNPDVHPDVEESCNDRDDDCDGLIDEDDVPDPFDGDNDDDGTQDLCDPCPFDPLDDEDADGHCADVDNCPAVYNPDQLNSDEDGAGDVCDPCPFDPLDDEDADGHCAGVDNCPTVYNPDQLDTDKDGIGDACDDCRFDPDNDIDNDGHCADVDNCPTIFNPSQLDFDQDGWGNDCDCAPFDPDTYPDAPEVNDGLDNQCPGDVGHGVIDETSGDCGFHWPHEPGAYSWPAQEEATLYRAARFADPVNFSSCVDAETTAPAWNDDSTPVPDELYYYLNRAVTPHEGSWGETSAQEERQIASCIPGPLVPSNDLCEFAIPLAVGDTISGTTTDATGPDRDTLSGTTISAPGVWYVVTGNGNNLTVSTCDQADYDTKISIFCPECAHDYHVVVAANDDDPGCSGYTSMTT